MGLAHDRRGSAGPIGIVELEPERDVQGETDRSPQAQAEEQGRRDRSQRIMAPPGIKDHPNGRRRPLNRCLVSVAGRIWLMAFRRATTAITLVYRAQQASSMAQPPPARPHQTVSTTRDDAGRDQAVSGAPIDVLR